MNKERYRERILETENLTDELEDAQAGWLLQWGIACLDQLLEGTFDNQEVAGKKINELMAVMRKINSMVGASPAAGPGRLAAEFATFNDLFNSAFKLERNLTDAECFSAAAQLKQFSPQQALEYLTGWGEVRSKASL
jgi:hypothetical protein